MGDKGHQLTALPSRQCHTYIGFPSNKQWDCYRLSATSSLPADCLQSVAYALLHPSTVLAAAQQRCDFVIKQRG